MKQPCPYQGGETGLTGVGVLIHGMGGLGKSSLAARLCDRLPTFERVVWVGRIDEASLVSRLAEKLDDNEQRKSLQNYDEELKFRLRRVFQQLHESAKPFLLVLDDFEVNLEPRNESYLLQAEAAEVLKALVWAIRENYTSHRIIITCRYDFAFTQLQHFYKQPLDGLQGADLRKKFNRLTAFGDKSQVDEALKLQAQKLADGNPRLLEWLDKILQNKTVDQAVILNQLAADPVELREQVLAEALLQQMDKTMREMLSRGLVFELPVPRDAFAAVCEHIPNLSDYISRAVALGLLEVSHDEALRVPRILPVQLSEDGEGLYKQAAEVLYRLWWEEAETGIEEQHLEIYRLAFLGNEEKKVLEVGSSLVRCWWHQGRYSREAIKICKSILKIIELPGALKVMAHFESEVGEVDKALEHYQQALNLCTSEDKAEKAAIINHLGRLKSKMGEMEEAFALYQQSLAIFAQISDVQAQGITLHEIAILKFKSGEIEEAIALYQKSLAITEQIGDVQSQAATLHCLGVLKADRGEIEEAITLYQKSLVLKEQIGNIKGQATTLYEMGKLKANRGEIEAAIALYQQSLTITEQIGDIQGKARTLNQLGTLKANSGEIEAAIALYQQSLTITEQIGDIQGKATTLYAMGKLKANRGEIEAAIALYQQSLAITEQIGDVQGQANILWWLGHIAEQQGNYNQALDYLQPAWEILQRIQSPNAERLGQVVARVQDLIRNS